MASVFVRISAAEEALLDELRHGETRPACFRRLLHEAGETPTSRPAPNANEALELLAEQARAGRTAAVVAYARLFAEPNVSEQDRYAARRLDELAAARVARAGR